MQDDNPRRPNNKIPAVHARLSHARAVPPRLQAPGPGRCDAPPRYRSGPSPGSPTALVV